MGLQKIIESIEKNDAINDVEVTVEYDCPHCNAKNRIYFDGFEEDDICNQCDAIITFNVTIVLSTSK